MISVLILNFNYGRYLVDALESVRDQTVDEYEVIIADDGSTDDSEQVYAEWEAVIDRVVKGPNVGLGRNIERALPYCTRELLAVTSADDRWLPNHLEVGMKALMAAPDAALSYSAVRAIDGEGRLIPTARTRRGGLYPSGWIRPEDLLPGQFIPTQSTIFRRSVVDELGIDPDLTFVELDLLVRIVAQYPVVFTGATTVEYRVHPSSMSRNSEANLQARLTLYEKHFGTTVTRTKRKFVAAAHLQTSYTQLVDHPSRESVRLARNHVLFAFRLDPLSALRPLHLVMLLLSLGGTHYAAAYPRLRRWFDTSRTKLVLQSLLGIKGGMRFGRVS